MAVILIHDDPGANPDMIEGMRQAGIIDRLKAAPGFKGHWSGATGTGYRVIELWESQDAWQAWFDSTIKPNTPPGAEPGAPTFIELTLAVEPG